MLYSTIAPYNSILNYMIMNYGYDYVHYFFNIIDKTSNVLEYYI